MSRSFMSGFLPRAGHRLAHRAVPRRRPLRFRHRRAGAALSFAVQMHALGLLLLPRRRLKERAKTSAGPRGAGAILNAILKMRRCRRSVDTIDLGSGAARTHRAHDDLRPDVNPVVEIDHVLVEQADAARGHEAADGLGRVGAVVAIDGIAYLHCATASRIPPPTSHQT